MLEILLQSLLPKGFQRRVALNSVSSNNKPRFSRRGLKRLENISQKFLVLGILSLSLLGYQPALQFPPAQQKITLAVEDQTQEIQADILPILQLPHPGYLSGRYSRFHPGVDIATGLGMPIHPIAEGEVIGVNYGFFGYGNHIIISHIKDLESLYGHMGRVYVTKGQKVSAEDTLGTVGMSGFTSGPHTHLEITRYGSFIDPQTILPPLQNYPSEQYLKPYGGDTQDQKLSKSLKPDFN